MLRVTKYLRDMQIFGMQNIQKLLKFSLCFYVLKKIWECTFYKDLEKFPNPNTVFQYSSHKYLKMCCKNSYKMFILRW